MQVSRSTESTIELTTALQKTKKDNRELQNAVKLAESKGKKSDKAQRKAQGSVPNEWTKLAEAERLYQKERDRNEVSYNYIVNVANCIGVYHMQAFQHEVKDMREDISRYEHIIATLKWQLKKSDKAQRKASVVRFSSCMLIYYLYKPWCC